MKHYTIILLSGLLLVSIACTDLLKEVNTSLSEEEMAEGLKAALQVGTDTAVGRLSSVNGYLKDEAVKILLPPEGVKILNTVNSIPDATTRGIINDQIDKVIESMNRAAEDAASEARPIFVEAITNLTIQDAIGILNGPDTAATGYLHGATYSQLLTAFTPKINNSLNNPIVFGQSTESLYKDLINAYNTASLGGFLFDQITENSLSTHVTSQALTGLFFKVGDEERMIRHDPLHRVSEILKKVFGNEYD
ncbi:DUF4197 domain-containing protein [Cytophagaceae bacterium ABcell3]|nr:DUF4197 domain-containing protein [Cytophagaceae bacterium ABcell3]